MEDGGDAGREPPPPPSPTFAASPSLNRAYHEKSDEPLKLENEKWDIWSISALAAMQMLQAALETLAEATGDVPPTPPVSIPTTPNSEDTRLRRLSSPEVAMSIGSPEAHPHEPLAIAQYAPDTSVQHAAIARRFFSKSAPSFSLEQYLVRMHTHCPHSPGVYLAAASFCHRLCVAELKVPATNRTIHRLALAAIRVSAKALEDNKWHQRRVAQVGGVSISSLTHLEVALCFLLDFDLWVDDKVLARGIFQLQQAARQGKVARTGKLGDQFKLKLPSRKKMALAQS